MPDHTVKQGEHLSGIAAKYGFRDYHTIWDHGNNAALKASRKNPNVIYPGDVLYIPEKQEKIVNRATGAVHVFQVNIQPLELRLVVKDCNRLPRKNVPCILTVDGVTETLTTDGDGLIHKFIPRTSQKGSVKIDGVEIPLKVGHLDPIDEYSGQAARLNNLGYDAGDPEHPDDDRFESAVEEFQCDNNLAVDGTCGAQTQAKLKDVHGC